MAQINFAKGEVQCKIVYYGPAESGKTANLRMINERSPERIRGKLTTIATDGNRTLFFDFLSLNLGKVATMRTKLNLYAVPYIQGRNALRVLVLEGVDGIVFVADARKDQLEANREALENLRANLVELGRDPDEIPIIFQANKMELEGVVDAARLADALDLAEGPAFDASAIEGTGVLATLKAVTGQVLDKASAMMGGQRPASATAATAAAPAPEAAKPKPVEPVVEREPEPVFTPAWHREAPDDPVTATGTGTIDFPPPSTSAHKPNPAIMHGNQQSAPVTPATQEPTTPLPPAPTPTPAIDPADLKKTAAEVESHGAWEDGPVTDPYMEASEEEQPFPASGGGMAHAEPKEEPASRPQRAVSVGAGGTRGRVRTKELPEFGWGPVETIPLRSRSAKPKRKTKKKAARPITDRRQRQRPNWRAEPPSARAMTAGAMAALTWLAVTGYLVFELL